MEIYSHKEIAEMFFIRFTYSSNNKKELEKYRSEFTKVYERYLDWQEKNPEFFSKSSTGINDMRCYNGNIQSMALRIHVVLRQILEEFSVKEFEEFAIEHFMESFKTAHEIYPYHGRKRGGGEYFDCLDSMLTFGMDFTDEYFENYKSNKTK